MASYGVGNVQFEYPFINTTLYSNQNHVLKLKYTRSNWLSLWFVVRSSKNWKSQDGTGRNKGPR